MGSLSRTLADTAKMGMMKVEVFDLVEILSLLARAQR